MINEIVWSSRRYTPSYLRIVRSFERVSGLNVHVALVAGSPSISKPGWFLLSAMINALVGSIRTILLGNHFLKQTTPK